jgi:hypothetical protein
MQRRRAGDVLNILHGILHVTATFAALILQITPSQRTTLQPSLHPPLSPEWRQRVPGWSAAKTLGFPHSCRSHLFCSVTGLPDSLAGSAFGQRGAYLVAWVWSTCRSSRWARSIHAGLLTIIDLERHCASASASGTSFVFTKPSRLAQVHPTDAA